MSRYGVIPITADQDTPGRWRRRVTDAAILLGALEGAAPDPERRGHASTCTPPPGRDYTRFLERGRPQGRAHRHSARVLLRQASRRPATKEPRGGLNPDAGEGDGRGHRRSCKRAGRDHRGSRRHPERRRRRSRRATSCSGASAAAPTTRKGKDADCSVVFKYGMKRDFNKWLAVAGRAGAGQDADRAARLEHRAPEGRRHQVRAVAARHLGRDGRRDRSRALRGRPRARTCGSPATHGIDEVMKAQRLDALLFPGPSGAAIAARPGYPTVIVPFGLVPNAPDAARSRTASTRSRRPTA